MYRPSLNGRERSTSLAAVLAIHAALAFAFLNLSGALPVVDREDLTELISIAVEPPPPPVVEIPVEEEPAPKKEGAASPKNIESQATPVAAPKPRIPLPVPPPIPVTETPRVGSDPTQGAAPVAGPGTGAGGIGTGTGAGGSGSGPGGGGDGFAVVRTRLANRPLTGRDFPDELLDRWPPGAPIFMRFRVDSRGFIIECIVDRGTGDPAIDSSICAIARARLRFRPGLDRDRRPVADWFAYGQRPPR